MIIGINGRIGHGKDTTAEMIIEILRRKPSTWKDKSIDNQWQIKKFAGKLKQIANILTGIPIEKFEDQDFKKEFLPVEWNKSLPNIVTGENRTTVREFLQVLGTEAIRDNLHKNAWVNALFSDYNSSQNWIITDTRFENEAKAIKEREGIIIRVNRKIENNTAKLHPSETSLDKWQFDYTIENDGSLSDLFNKVKLFIDKFNLYEY